MIRRSLLCARSVHGGSRSGACLVLSIVSSLCVCTASAAGSSAEFTFAKGQSPLFVPVQWGTRTYDFVLDTGCTGTILDLSFRTQLGEPTGRRTISSVANPIATEIFAAPNAFVGSFNLADCGDVMCADLKGFARMVGRDVHGVLGMDVLKKHVIQIDFDEGRIAFLDNEQTEQRDWGLEFPITYNGMKMPQMRLAVGGRPELDFVVDTGCDTSGALAKDNFRLAVAKDGLKPVRTSMFAVAGTVKSRQVRVEYANAGPLEYRGLIFSEAKGNLLGLDFLSRHVVTFDFPNDRVYLRKGESFGKRDEAGMCGVSLVRSEGRTVVSGIWRKGPAAKAGIRVGDAILELDGQSANAFERWQIRDLLRSSHGKQIAMTIQRGSRIKNMVVTLERQL